MGATEKLGTRVVGFDLVRIFACLCVLTVHFNAQVSGYSNDVFVYNNSIVPNHYLGGRAYLGTIGVCLFFMLSGAALTLSYRGLKRFYIKRFLSIYPMFWLAYAIVFFYDFLINKHFGEANPLLLIATALGMDGYLFSQGMIDGTYYRIGEWFLGCIVLLYLIYPLLRRGMEKKPILTFVAAVVIYALLVRRLREVKFILRIPEMLIGIAISQYHWERKPWRLTAAGAAILLAAWLLRDYLSALTITIALAFFLFGLLCALGQYIPERVSCTLAKLSALCFPAFLVHHQLIAKLTVGFDLPNMRRRDVLMLYIIYMVLTYLLSVGLQKLTANVLARFPHQQQVKA